MYMKKTGSVFLMSVLIAGCVTLPQQEPHNNAIVEFDQPQVIITPRGKVSDAVAAAYYPSGNLEYIRFREPKYYDVNNHYQQLQLKIESMWFYPGGEVKKVLLSGIVPLFFEHETQRFKQNFNGKPASGLCWFYKSGIIKELNFADYVPLTVLRGTKRIKKVVFNEYPLEGRSHIKYIQVDEGTVVYSDGRTYEFNRGDIINISDEIYWGKLRWDEEKEAYVEAE
jgi:hypothetical protein